MKYQVAVLALSSLLFFSCKKDRLKDNKAVFIGTWNWIYSIHSFDYCDGDPNFEETITPDTDGYNYTLEFLERGVVKFYENNNYLEKKRVVLSLFKDLGGYYDFAINLNNETNLDGTLNGYISTDTIIVTTGFPYGNFREGCESYTSYFVKQ